jgi:ketosteroid isomerase-like protein
MLKSLRPLIAVISLASCATTQAHSPSTLEQQLQRHIAALHARSMSELAATITTGEDLLLILPSGRTTHTRADYLAFHESLFAAKGWVITFEPIHLQRLGEYAHALYRVTFDDDGAGPVPARPAHLSLGFRLEGGEWRLLHDQNTPVSQ